MGLLHAKPRRFSTMSDNTECIEVQGSKKLLLDTFSFTPAQYLSGLHCHHYLEIGLVKTGKANYISNGKLYEFRAGDIFVFGNNDTHGITYVFPPETFTIMTLHFEPAFIWSQNGNIFDLKYLKVFMNRSDSFENLLDIENPITTEVRNLFLDIEKEFNNKLPEYEAMIKVKLLNILVNLSRGYGYVRNAQNCEHRRKELLLLEEVMEYIDNYILEDLRLETLAEIACMSPSYFSSFFKKVNGLSPSQYILRKRIYRVIEHIRHDDKPILEIAYMCGFNNAANFYRIFKKITGNNPTDYR
jgi:AraC-like DNA-binding protein/quercetin dioxygenase-like cupin family protein